MTATGVPAARPAGVLRMTWVQDRQAPVVEHSDAAIPHLHLHLIGIACPG